MDEPAADNASQSYNSGLVLRDARPVDICAPPDRFVDKQLDGNDKIVGAMISSRVRGTVVYVASSSMRQPFSSG